MWLRSATHESRLQIVTAFLKAKQVGAKTQMRSMTRSLRLVPVVVLIYGVAVADVEGHDFEYGTNDYISTSRLNWC